MKVSSMFSRNVIMMSVAALGAISLASCSPTQPPAANVDSATSVAKQNSQSKTQPTTLEAKQPSTPETPTLKNLQAAYNGESNAHVMYLAFANKADEEGYKDVATLFKAVARAEEIHRDNHAKVIQAMGATPKNNITTPDVKSTGDNLEKAVGGNLSQAIKGESYERDTMYPIFIKQAKAESNQAAVQTFDYALAAETQHAQLYTEIKNNLNDWKQASRQFYVCTVSGETFVNSPPTSCPQTKTGKDVEQVI
jgi:rubrerythrin